VRRLVDQAMAGPGESADARESLDWTLELGGLVGGLVGWLGVGCAVPAA
jgi:hypothetical protein